MKLGSSSPMWGTEIQKPSLWQVHISSWPVLWNPNGSEYWAPSVHLSDCQFFGHRDLPQLGTTFSRSRSHQHKQYIEKNYIYIYVYRLKDTQSISEYWTGNYRISNDFHEIPALHFSLIHGELPSSAWNRASKLKVFPGGSPMKSRSGTFWTNI